MAGHLNGCAWPAQVLVATLFLIGGTIAQPGRAQASSLQNGSPTGEQVQAEYRAREDADLRRQLDAHEQRELDQVCLGAWGQRYQAAADQWAAQQPLVMSEFADKGPVSTKLSNLKPQTADSRVFVCSADLIIGADDSRYLVTRINFVVDTRGNQIQIDGLNLPTLTLKWALDHTTDVFELKDGKRIAWAEVARLHAEAEAAEQRRLAEQQRQEAQRLAQEQARQAKQRAVQSFWDPRRDCGAHLMLCRYVRAGDNFWLAGDVSMHWSNFVGTLSIMAGRQHLSAAQITAFRARIFALANTDADRCKIFGNRDFIDCMNIVIDAETNEVRNTYDVGG